VLLKWASGENPAPFRIEQRIPLDRVEDIYKHADALRETARQYA